MLENLQSNVEKLIAAYEAASCKAKQSELEAAKFKKQYEEALEKINKLEEKIDSLSLRSVFVPPLADNSEAKAKIDRLIGEIDSALALLQ